MNKNEELVRNVFKVWETGNTEEIEQYTDSNFMEHTPDPAFKSDKKGIEYVKDLISTYREAFSNLKVDIKQVITNENKAVVYSTFKGKHTGMLNDIPPTNKEVSFDNIDIMEINNGKISGHWGIADNLNLMMQIGVLTEAELHPH
ncbi:MAG: ester cyclase [Bacteroidetes bacterium]|nr:ester cyclase [Bacteroidota bacterium]